MDGLTARVCTFSDRKKALDWFNCRMHKMYGKGYTLSFDWFDDNSGIAVEKDGRLLALVILYIESARNVGQIGWVVTNPENKPRESYEALDLAIAEVIKLARDKDVRYLMSYIAVPGINKLLGKHGLLQGDRGVEQRICRLR